MSKTERRLWVVEAREKGGDWYPLPVSVEPDEQSGVRELEEWREFPAGDDEYRLIEYVPKRDKAAGREAPKR